MRSSRSLRHSEYYHTDEWDDRFSRKLARAVEYHWMALWQEEVRLLQEILPVCDEPGFPDRQFHKLNLLYDIGGVRRRLGQYDAAEDALRQALDVAAKDDELIQAEIMGELVVVLRHSNKLEEALQMVRKQYAAAKAASGDSPRGQAEMEMCRAIGNEGMISFNLSQLPQYADEKQRLLIEALTKLEERVERARALRSEAEYGLDNTSRIAKTWEVIGLDRQILCRIALGQFPQALAIAEESQAVQRVQRVDPTTTAYSRCNYGLALWYDGHYMEAREQWNAGPAGRSSTIVCCQEISREHLDYLRLMADAGVDFDSYDEQGFSALDHAVFSQSPDAPVAISIVVRALRESIKKSLGADHAEDDRARMFVDHELHRRMHQAELRKFYRTMLQEHLRPQLRKFYTRSLNNLRQSYEDHRPQWSNAKGPMFSPFRFVRYEDFKQHGELPQSTTNLARAPEISHATGSQVSQDSEDLFIIFFSYRWIGGGKPDDDQHTQWRRMMAAIDELLQRDGYVHLRKENVGIWLDYACIDQVDEGEKERGIDSLPTAVLLCDAMISLVDEAYFTRAWCAVEVLLMQTLVDSYHMHERWEHVLKSPADRVSGSLHRAESMLALDVADLKLTNEVMDRPKVDFLIRQSKLLGKDDV